jgi:restriction system protein
VLNELPTQFFRVPWRDQDDLIRELLANYDKLEDEIKAELPLKRIWTVTAQEEAE